MGKISLLKVTATRASNRSVSAFPVAGVIADGETILTLGNDIAAIEGGRLLGDNSWSGADADGAALTTALGVADSVTNIVVNSENFLAGWPTSTAIVTAASGISPNGENVASKVADKNEGGTGLVDITRSLTVLTATEYTFSLYVKADQTSQVGLGQLGFTTPANDATLFDLPTQTITKSAQHSAATIEDVGDGWYRCSVTFTTDAVVTTGTLRILLAEADSFTVPRDGTTSILIWGAQFEVGSYASPYIPTAGATASRAADVITTALPTILTAAKGALDLTVDALVAGQVNKSLVSSYVDASNYLDVFVNATQITLRKRVGGVNTDAVFTYTHIAGTPFRCQLFWDDTDGIGIRAADASADITAVSFVTDADTADMPLDTDLAIGNLNGGAIFQSEFSSVAAFADQTFTAGKKVKVVGSSFKGLIQ